MLRITFEDNTEWTYHPENRVVVAPGATYLMKEAVDPIPGAYFKWHTREGYPMAYYRKVKRVATV